MSSLPKFVESLARMVDEGVLAGWNADGRSFWIVRKDNRALKQFFSHQKYTSLSRQLLLYDFTRLESATPDKSIYSHPSFVEGRPDLLHDVRSKQQKANERDALLSGKQLRAAIDTLERNLDNLQLMGRAMNDYVADVIQAHDPQRRAPSPERVQQVVDYVCSRTRGVRPAGAGAASDSSANVSTNDSGVGPIPGDFSSLEGLHCDENFGGGLLALEAAALVDAQPPRATASAMESAAATAHSAMANAPLSGPTWDASDEILIEHALG